MQCGLSGEIPVEPVVNRKTGHLYERRLIEKYIEQFGRCPITGDALTLDDLIPVKSYHQLATGGPTRPRPPSATSVPGLLQLFQAEWDALMLESFALRQTLDSTRQELAHALYQHDAACRVIARLLKDRDAPRVAIMPPLAGPGSGASAWPDPATAQQSESLASVKQPQELASGGDDLRSSKLQPVELPISPLSESDWDELAHTGDTLRKTRKSRRMPADLPKPEHFASLHHSVSLSVFRSSATTPGSVAALGLSMSGGGSSSSNSMTCLDVHSHLQSLVVAGSESGNVALVDVSGSPTVIGYMTGGHGAAVTSAQCHPAYRQPGELVVLSSSSDGSVVLWQQQHQQQQQQLSGQDASAAGGSLASSSSSSSFAIAHRWANALGRRNSPAVSISLHPSGRYFATCGTLSWAMYSLDAPAACVQLVADVGGSVDALTVGKYHPDGMLFAAGTALGAIRIWDVRSGKVGATLTLDAATTTTTTAAATSVGPVTSIAMSENGYHMLAGYGAVDGQQQQAAHLWDLRKIALAADLSGGLSGMSGPVHVAFDISGTFAAVGSAQQISVYSTSSKAEFSRLGGAHVDSSDAGPVAFVRNGSMICAASLRSGMLKAFVM